MTNTAFEAFCSENKIEYNTKVPMKEHTSFKIGGAADYFVKPKNIEALSKVLKQVNLLELPYYIIGKGSNLLVSDDGIDGVVISLLDINEITVDGDVIAADSGCNLANVCQVAMENELEGLEFAYGIPGSVGGALYMNAGAYGGEMSQVVDSAHYLTADGQTQGILSIDDMKLGYRTSIFNSCDKIITRVVFKLKKGNRDTIKEKMDDFLSRRKDKQPLNFPSAGSTFKRPVGNYAGTLIEKNNLKGYSIGGAMVSEKHAGFIINFDNATCNDVKKLIKFVSDTVCNADGVTLEPEVIFVGR